jgi:hypothetical protein
VLEDPIAEGKTDTVADIAREVSSCHSPGQRAALKAVRVPVFQWGELTQSAPAGKSKIEPVGSDVEVHRELCGKGRPYAQVEIRLRVVRATSFTYKQFLRTVSPVPQKCLKTPEAADGYTAGFS